MILKKIPCLDPVAMAGYIFGPGRRKVPDRAEYVGGTLLGRDPPTLSHELLALRNLRPEVARPFIHVAISLHVEDRRLSEVEVIQMGEELARVMDVEAWVLVSHSDTDHPHWHWVASRIGFGGRLTREHLRDYRLFECFGRNCERWFALKEVSSPVRPDRPYGRSVISIRPGRAESEARAQGRPLAMGRLKAEIRDALAKGYRGQALLNHLRGRGFTSRIAMKRGVPCGVTWVVHPEGFRFRGSSLGPQFTGKTFFSRGGFYVKTPVHLSPRYRACRRRIILHPYHTISFERHWAKLMREWRRGQQPAKRGWWKSLVCWLWGNPVSQSDISWTRRGPTA